MIKKMSKNELYECFDCMNSYSYSYLAEKHTVGKCPNCGKELYSREDVLKKTSKNICSKTLYKKLNEVIE